MTEALDIPTVLDRLYGETGVARPSPERPITLLADLIGGLNLACVEVSGLSSSVAEAYLLRRGGLIEPALDTSDEALAGYLIANIGCGSIFVEQDDLVVRRRFSAAHELGHYLLHFRPLLDSLRDDLSLVGLTDAFPVAEEDLEPDELPVGHISARSMTAAEPHSISKTAGGSCVAQQGVSVRPVTADLLPDFTTMERQANRFAAELLMPADIVRELVLLQGRGADIGALAPRLASEMLVSRAAMRWRLRSLEAANVA